MATVTNVSQRCCTSPAQMSSKWSGIQPQSDEGFVDLGEHQRVTRRAPTDPGHVEHPEVGAVVVDHRRDVGRRGDERVERRPERVGGLERRARTAGTVTSPSRAWPSRSASAIQPCSGRRPRARPSPATDRPSCARRRGRVVAREGGTPVELGRRHRHERQALERRARRRGSRPRTRWPGRPARRPGGPYCSSTPPTLSIAIRSPSRMASSMSWVTNTIVLRSSRLERAGTRPAAASRTIGSTAPNGSSISSTGGSAASARATPTRCCWPPESSAG